MAAGWRGTAADGAQVELHDLPLLDLPMENAALALQAYLLMGLPWDAAQVRQALLDPYHRASGSSSLNWQGKPVDLLLDVGTTRMRRSTWRGAWRPAAKGAVWRCSACWPTRIWMALSRRCRAGRRLGGGAAGYAAQPPGCELATP
jgi:hypothetical protein